MESSGLVPLRIAWAPVQPDASGALALCGAGLVSLWLRRASWTVAIGAGVAAIGAFTGLQYLLNTDFSLATLPLEPLVVPDPGHPGPAHPLTCLALVLAGGGLIGAGLRRSPRTAFLLVTPPGLILLVFASMVPLAYAGDLGAVMGWRELTRVALYDSLAFGLIGTALVLHAWAICVRTHVALPPWSAWVAGAVVVAISVFFWRALSEREHVQVDRYMHAEAAAIQAQMTSIVNARIEALVRMKERWEARGGTPQAEWEADAASIVRDQPGYQAIAWVDADLRFRWIQPMAGNELLSQHDLNADPARRLLHNAARESRRVFISEPFELVQGNSGFVAIVPIFVGNAFQGFIHASLRYDRLFVNTIAENAEEGIGVSLWHANKEVISTSTVVDHSAPRHYHHDMASFTLYNQVFSLSAWTTPKFENAHSLLPEIVLVTGLIVALLLVATLKAADKARLRLDRSERHFRNIVEQSLQGILVTTENVLFVNEAHARMFGYTAEEFMSLPSVFDCYHPDDIEMMHSIVAERRSGSCARRTVELRGIRNDGGVFWLQQMSSRIEWQGASAAQIVSIDITERKLAEQRLADSEKQYRETFENAPVAMTWISPEGKFIATNQAFQQMLGYTSDELKGMKRGDVIHPKFAERRARDIEEYLAGRTDRLIAELQLVRKDGKAIWALVSTCVIRDDAGKPRYLIGHLQDITENKLSEEKLFQAQKMEALGNFAGGIAHDFNNMLLPIVALTEITKDELPADSLLQENMEAVLQAANQASKLVRQILTFSRQDEHDVAALDISQCVSGAIELLRNVLPTTITVTRKVEPDVGIVMGDRAQLDSVIMNLGSNAADAMDGKVGLLELRLARMTPDAALVARVPDLREGRPYAKISVKDSGCGMDQATIEKIFNPFFTTKAPGEGTGLGLAMVHGIIERHSGAVDVTSEVGVGTTFDIFLPLQEAGQSAAGKAILRPADRVLA